MQSREERQARIDELKSLVASDPAAGDFVELAKLLNEEGATRPEARELCYRGLTANPHNLQGRLALAHSFYLDGLGEFCIRELFELQRHSQAPALGRLIQAFGEFGESFRKGPDSAPSARSETPARAVEDGVVAEIDLEADFADVFEELEDEQED